MQFQVGLLGTYSLAFYSVVKIVYLVVVFFWYTFRIESQYKTYIAFAEETIQDIS